MRPWYLGMVALLTLWLAGCQHSQVGEKPRVMGEKRKIDYAQTILENSTRQKKADLEEKKMELKARQEIERIRAEKELQIARLKAESEQSKVLTEKELTLKKIQAKIEEIVGDRKIAGWVIALSALFLFLLLFVIVKLFSEYHKHKRRLEDERMRHEKEIEEKKLQARLAEKMFDTLASGNLNEEQQKRLLDTIAGSVPKLTMKK